jgi:hypothetical protein
MQQVMIGSASEGAVGFSFDEVVMVSLRGDHAA